MKTIALLSVAFLLSVTANPVLAGPLEDARRSLEAGALDDVLMTIAIGAIAANSQDDDGYTLLHYAARQGSADAVKALLDRGADPMIKGHDGKTPLDLATVPAIRAELVAAIAAHAPAGG